MGEQLHKVSMKWSPATLEHEAELLNAFAGLVEGRSQLSRVTMKIVWRLVRTVGILRVIEEFVQDKQSHTLCEQIGLEFPAPAYSEGTPAGKRPPVRVSPSRDGARIGGKKIVNLQVVVGMGAWSPLFPGKVSPLNSITYARCA